MRRRESGTWGLLLIIGTIGSGTWGDIVEESTRLLGRVTEKLRHGFWGLRLINGVFSCYFVWLLLVVFARLLINLLFDEGFLGAIRWI